MLKKRKIKRCLKKKIIIIGNGCNLDEKRIQRLKKVFLKKNNKIITVGFLGRFDVTIKGLDCLLRAYKAIKRIQKLKVNFCFIGNIDQRKLIANIFQ